MSDAYENIRSEQRKLRREIAHLRDELHRLERRLEDLERQARTARERRSATERASPPATSSEESSRRASFSVRQRQLSDTAQALLAVLPRRFTVEDLISVSEEHDINVFQAYQDLQVLIRARKVRQENDVYEKVESNQPLRSP